MKKHINKTTIIISSILLIIAGLYFYNSSVRIDRVETINEYSDFYWFKMRSTPIISFNFGTGGPPALCRVWFLPGQKQKLLDQIKKDVNDELANLTSEYNDFIKNYEISDDFKYIYIYIFMPNRPRFFNETEKLKPKVSLYHQLIHGWGVGLSKIINFIEIEEN